MTFAGGVKVNALEGRADDAEDVALVLEVGVRVDVSSTVEVLADGGSCVCTSVEVGVLSSSLSSSSGSEPSCFACTTNDSASSLSTKGNGPILSD